MGALASSKNGNDIMTLLEGYQLCATTEGKSGKTIEIATRSVTYFTRFLTGHVINYPWQQELVPGVIFSGRKQGFRWGIASF